jgi:transposase
MPKTRVRAVVLEADVQAELERVVASRTEEIRRVQRAKIILMAAAGETNKEIAESLGVNTRSVYNCLKKFSEMGAWATLADLARTGRPATISDEEKAWVISVACMKPKELGYAQELWTIKKLTDHVHGFCVVSGYPRLANVSRSTVWAILDAAELKPHKIRYYLEKRDPDFDAKMTEVLLVYKQLEIEFEGGDASGIAVVSYDEKPGIQAISNIALDLAPVPGTCSCVGRDYEYKRLGTLSLLCALDLKTGNVIPLVRDTHKSSDFIDFLKLLDERYIKATKIRVVLDNHSAHTSKETRAYLSSVPGRFEFIFTPKHGSWLNLVESFFGKMARVFLRGIRVKSKEELAERIYRYIDEVNAEPVVYRWTYKMDDVAV